SVNTTMHKPTGMLAASGSQTGGRGASDLAWRVGIAKSLVTNDPIYVSREGPWLGVTAEGAALTWPAPGLGPACAHRAKGARDGCQHCTGRRMPGRWMDGTRGRRRIR